MSAETEFRAAMAVHVPLASLVGTRIALNAVKQDEPLPYVVFTARREPQLLLSSAVALTRTTFEVQCWAFSAADANAVADAVQTAVSAVTGAVATVIDRATGYDPDLGLDATVITVEWWSP